MGCFFQLVELLHSGLLVHSYTVPPALWLSVLCQRSMSRLKFQNIEVNNITHNSATFFKGTASQRKNWLVLQSYGSNSGRNNKRCYSYSYSVLFPKLWSLPYYVRLHPRDVTVFVFEDAQSIQITTTLKINILCISIWIFMSRIIFCVDTGIFSSILCIATVKYKIKTQNGEEEKNKNIFFFF